MNDITVRSAAMAEALRAACPHAASEVLERVSAGDLNHPIGPKINQFYFLAQCGHESQGFTRFEENLHYTAKRMCAVWPSRFTSLAQAKTYEGHPEALANYVYANRMGNTAPGDGYRYRGRGAIQITGKSNYKVVGEACGLPLVDIPELAADPENALKIAIAWWQYHKCAVWCDRRDFKGLTRVINGGFNGLPERRELLNRIALEYEHLVRTS